MTNCDNDTLGRCLNPLGLTYVLHSAIVFTLPMGAVCQESAQLLRPYCVRFAGIWLRMCDIRHAGLRMWGSLWSSVTYRYTMLMAYTLALLARTIQWKCGIEQY